MTPDKDQRTTIARTIEDLRTRVATWRADGERIALVPTMGALHQGHLSLMRLAQKNADRVVVSIFVNPTQFGPGEDFEQYPRTEDDDLYHLNSQGVDLAFIPTRDEMYLEGFATEVKVKGLTDVLCGKVRPGHFDGVAVIVTKLLLCCLPDVAIFGEKDYQQLQIIRRFAADLNIPAEIMGGPILREADSLAMSSRNQYLTDEERQTAALFPRILQDTRDAILGGANIARACISAKDSLLAGGFDAVDYVQVRDAETLAFADNLDRPARIFGAVRIGATRLIDNWPVAQ